MQTPWGTGLKQQNHWKKSRGMMGISTVISNIEYIWAMDNMAYWLTWYIIRKYREQNWLPPFTYRISVVMLLWRQGKFEAALYWSVHVTILSGTRVYVDIDFEQGEAYMKQDCSQHQRQGGGKMTNLPPSWLSFTCNGFQKPCEK